MKRSIQFIKGHRAHCYGGEISATDAGATTHPVHIARLTSQEAQDLVSMPSSSYLPYTHRPKHEKEEIGSENVDLTENVILNMGKLKELINLVHGNSCKGPRVNVDIVDRTGICVCEVQCMSFPCTVATAVRHGEKGYRTTSW